MLRALMMEHLIRDNSVYFRKALVQKTYNWPRSDDVVDTHSLTSVSVEEQLKAGPNLTQAL